MKFDMIKSGAGIGVPAAYFPAAKPASASLLMLPAMGVEARFYKPFAESLSNAGVNVALMEQRGHGESPERAARGRFFGCKDYIQTDIPAALDWLKGRAETAGAPLYLAGHSMGGHMAASYAALYSEAVDGLLLFACSLPMPRYFETKSARRIRFLTRILPLILSLVGYFPGNRIGFAGREYRGIMEDWRTIAKTGRYDFAGIEADIEAAAATFRKPVGIFSMENDRFAPVDAVLAVADKFKTAPLAKRRMLSADLGGHTGHFNWVRGMDAGAAKIVGVIKHFQNREEK